jgi:hypothetical protein
MHSFYFYVATRAIVYHTNLKRASEEELPGSPLLELPHFYSGYNNCRPPLSCWIQQDDSDDNEDNGEKCSSSDNLPRMYCELCVLHMLPVVQEIFYQDTCL